MSKFNVGDVLRVREWDDMANEHGVRGGDIRTELYFLESMRNLCGQTFTVAKIDNWHLDSNVEIYHSVEKIEKELGVYISADMLEYFCEPIDTYYDDTEILEFIDSFKVG